jgi:hypothetical protein
MARTGMASARGSCDLDLFPRIKVFWGAVYVKRSGASLKGLPKPVRPTKKMGWSVFFVIFTGRGSHSGYTGKRSVGGLVLFF